MIPDDLRYRLDVVLGGVSRSTAADFWTDQPDWLFAHGVAPPEHLPKPEQSRSWTADQSDRAASQPAA